MEERQRLKAKENNFKEGENKSKCNTTSFLQLSSVISETEDD